MIGNETYADSHSFVIKKREEKGHGEIWFAGSAMTAAKIYADNHFFERDVAELYVNDMRGLTCRFILTRRREVVWDVEQVKTFAGEEI